MDAEKLLDLGERGVHLLFDTPTIREAVGQDAKHLRGVIEENLDEIQDAVVRVLELRSAQDGRAFIAGLPRDLQHVLVLLWLEMLDDRLRRRELRH